MEKYTLTFDSTDLRVLSMAIGEIPTKMGKPLLDNINSQIAKQTEDTPFGVGSVPASCLNTGSGNP